MKPSHHQWRLFSEKLLRQPWNRVVAVPKDFHGERLDKFLMQQLNLTWTAAHKLVRTKKAFVVKKTAAPGTESRFVYRDSAYKIMRDDEVCLPKEQKKEAE